MQQVRDQFYLSTTDDGLYGDSSVLGVLFIILFGKKPVGRSVLERSRHSSEPTTTPISMLLSKMGPSQFCWKILCNKCGINSIYRPPMMACMAIRQFWESRYIVGGDAAFSDYATSALTFRQLPNPDDDALPSASSNLPHNNSAAATIMAHTKRSASSYSVSTTSVPRQ